MTAQKGGVGRENDLLAGAEERRVEKPEEAGLAEEWPAYRTFRKADHGDPLATLFAVRDAKRDGGIGVRNHPSTRLGRARSRRAGKVDPKRAGRCLGKNGVIRAGIEQAIPCPAPVRPAEKYRHEWIMTAMRATQWVDGLLYASGLIGKAHRTSEAPKVRIVQPWDVIENELQRIFPHVPE